jgi:succinyl-diaminopimelate desuccinylase
MSANLENSQEAIKFLQDMLRLVSVNPPGEEEAVAELIARRFEDVPNCSVELVSLAPGRSNVEIVLKAANPSAPPLLLTGHLDTVAPGDLSNWTHDPFAAELVDGKIFGRGASDMKGGVAAMVLALEALGREKAELAADVIFLGTVGEEVDSAGARHFFDRGRTEGVGAVVVGEPTAGDLIPAHKGALWLRLSTKGRTAHGSTPELGVNAIQHMFRLVEQLEEQLELAAPPHPLLRPPSMALTTFGGGVQTNVIPDRSQATLDIRTVPGLEHETILRKVNQVIERLSQKIPDFSAQVEVLNDRPPISTPPQAELITVAQAVYRDVTGREPKLRAANYYTDASALSVAAQIPTLIYGPGDDRLAHQPDEFVTVVDYLESIRFYYRLIKRYGQP